jgi:hypothetical protein
MVGAMVAINFETANDLFNRDIFWKILDVIGYHALFVGWLQTIYLVADISLVDVSFCFVYRTITC